MLSFSSFGVNYYSKGEYKALFLLHEGYLGALGAFSRNAACEQVFLGDPLSTASESASASASSSMGWYQHIGDGLRRIFTFPWYVLLIRQLCAPPTHRFLLLSCFCRDVVGGEDGWLTDDEEEREGRRYMHSHNTHSDYDDVSSSSSTTDTEGDDEDEDQRREEGVQTPTGGAAMVLQTIHLLFFNVLIVVCNLPDALCVSPSYLHSCRLYCGQKKEHAHREEHRHKEIHRVPT